MHDVIIIGAGPAGMTAALYTIRKKLDTLMLTMDFGGQLMWTRDIENYMGYQYITGPELIAKFEEQIKQFPIKVEYEETTKLVRQEDGTFSVYAGDKEYRSKAVIVASGKRPRRLMVPGEVEFTGLGVGYCATCDGPLYGGKTVAVVGGGNSGVQAAIELSAIAQKVYLIVRKEFRADPVVVDKLAECANVELLKGYQARSIHGRQTVEKFIVAGGDGDERELAVQGIFVEIGLDPNTEFLRGAVKFNQYNEVAVDCRARTDVPGLFAAGDVTSGPDKQIIIAAGEGAKAALGVYEYLLHRR